MKKNIIILAVITIFSQYLCGQDIKMVFRTIPKNVIWEMTLEQKEKLLSASEDSLAFVDDSNLYEKIQRTGFSDNFISLKTSDVGSVQIKLLPLVNDSKIICVVKTVCANICDSEIRFYTSSWVPIKQTDLFPKPRIDWFIRKDIDKNSDEYKNALAPLDINPVKLILSPEDDTLKAEYDIKNYLDKGDYEKLKPFIIEGDKVFSWDKISFK